MSMATPTAPSVYTWEATNEAVAEKYDVPIERILRFDLNTSPAPPDLVARVLAANRFETSLSEYPPSDYRRLSEAAADVYGVRRSEVLVGAGADEILDMTAKAFLAPGRKGRHPGLPPIRCIALSRSSAAARRSWSHGYWHHKPTMPRRPPSGSPRATRRAGLDLQPEQPHGPRGASGRDGDAADGLATDAANDARRPPAVAIDEAYAEFSGTTSIPLLGTYPDLVVIRTAARPMRSRDCGGGLRAGGAARRSRRCAR